MRCNRLLRTRPSSVYCETFHLFRFPSTSVTDIGAPFRIPFCAGPAQTALCNFNAPSVHLRKTVCPTVKYEYLTLDDSTKYFIFQIKTMKILNLFSSLCLRCCLFVTFPMSILHFSDYITDRKLCIYTPYNKWYKKRFFFFYF